MKILLATSNKGKIREIQSLLSTTGDFEVVGLDQFNLGDIPETGTTFLENALLKAKTASEKTGLITLADDSGLVVPYLGGEPGVYSARYSGKDATDAKNNAKLLEKLKGVPLEKRQAFFVCVLVAYAPQGKYFWVEGKWEGRIAFEPRGNKGFGYDPIFIDLETGKHAAEMDLEEKNQKSHRGKALQKFLKKWPKFLTEIKGEL